MQKHKASELVRVIARAEQDIIETPRYIVQYALSISAAEERMGSTRMVLVEKDFTRNINEFIFNDED